jgi:hypothetical protein
VLPTDTRCPPPVLGFWVRAVHWDCSNAHLKALHRLVCSVRRTGLAAVRLSQRLTGVQRPGVPARRGDVPNREQPLIRGGWRRSAAVQSFRMNVVEAGPSNATTVRVGLRRDVVNRAHARAIAACAVPAAIVLLRLGPRARRSREVPRSIGGGQGYFAVGDRTLNCEPCSCSTSATASPR